MGANKNSVRRKCGEILINIKTIKNKSKSFTFHCALCDMEYDQLKKFSKHLEYHMNYFETNLEDVAEVKNQNLLFGTDGVKVEDLGLIDNTECKVVGVTSTAEGYKDPLETGEPYKIDIIKICNGEESLCTNIKNEDAEELVNFENDDSKITSDSSSDILLRRIVEKPKKNAKRKHSVKDSDLSSDNSSDHDSDPNFNVEMELIPSKTAKTDGDKNEKTDCSSKGKKSPKEKVDHESKVIKKHKRCRRRWRKIDESKLPILIEIYKKYEILWQVNDIAFGIVPKRNEIFGKMIEELKSNHNFDKSLDELQDHIDFINYIYYKDKEQELKCELDKTEFKPLSKFYKDLSFLSDSQGPFKCSNCNEIIKKYDHYHIHVAQHSGAIPFQCRLCEMGFQKFDNYLRHITRHLGINSYHCNVCGKGYPLKSELDWHLTSHTGVKPFLCPICGAGFRARHGYDNHIRRHEKRFRYECHICKHGFNHLCKLNTHIKSHLNIRDVICNVCGKGFTAAKYLHRHKLIHEEEKRYKCNVCGKAFAQDSGLRTHRKQHQPYAAIAENKNLLNKCL